MGAFRGQGATEYLVLLAVVLIVALVSVALLGFFPGMAADARITQSQTYWRGQARPFSIMDVAINSTNATLSIMNKEASGQYVIPANGIQIGTVACTTAGASFSAGETETPAITVSGAFTPCSTPGAIYDYNVTITYNTPSMTGLRQYGTKNLIGKCT